MQISFDLETLGRGSHAPIVQIAATSFNLNGSASAGFFSKKIALGEDFKKFECDLSTVEWWLTQPEETRVEVFGGTREPLGVVLVAFAEWIAWAQAHGEGPLKLWSHATFDPPILMNAFQVMGVKPSFSFRDFMDIRTINFLAGPVEVEAREGKHHEALSDARYQARYIVAMQNKLKGKK